MRHALKKQLADMLRAIVEYFPSGTRVSAPRGGLCLWVELDQNLNGMVLFDRAGEENITIVPGSLCSATDNYRHCIRLNFGYPWTKESEKGVRVLGGIISELMEEHEIE